MMNVGFWEIMIHTLSDFNPISVAFRLLLAVVIGGCIGMERGHHGRDAGLRTHILVCVGAAMTVMVGLYATFEMGLDSDPLRVSAQVISGIGFLGAGTIMTQNNSRVRGLTTAAGLWTTASIGIAAGMGFYWGTLVAFAVALVTITVLSKIEKKPQMCCGKIYYLELCDAASVNRFCDEMAEKVTNVQIVAAKSGLSNHVGLICFFSDVESEKEMLEEIRELDCVVIAVPSM